MARPLPLLTPLRDQFRARHNAHPHPLLRPQRRRPPREARRVATCERIQRPRPAGRRRLRRKLQVQRRGRFARELLQRAAFGFRHEERNEHAAQHEQREDLHDVVQPRTASVARAVRGRAFRHQRLRHDLRNDGADFAHRRRETMARRAVARRETLARDDERGGVRAKIEE